jgi:hypothetical protein
MTLMDTETLAAAPPPAASFRFRATDVTGTLEMDVDDLQSSAPAGAVARTLAQRMELPTNVPWALRDDRGAYLLDDGQIGDQIAADATVTLTPKAHLG